MSKFFTFLALKMQIKPAEPFDIEPKKQVMQMFLFTSQSPFAACPEFSLTFRQSGKTYRVGLRLPLSVTKFSSKLDLDGPAFKTLWSQHKEECKFAVSSSVSVDFIKEKLLPGLKLSVVVGIDSGSGLSLSGQFNYLSATSGNVKSSPILVRMQVTGVEVKLICHSNSSLVCAGLESTFRMMLSS
jgi:hypothetical protein